MLSKRFDKWVINDNLKSGSLRLHHRLRHHHLKPSSETFLPVNSRYDICDETIASIIKKRSRVYSHEDGANCYFDVPSPKENGVVWIVPTGEDDTQVWDDADLVGETDDVKFDGESGNARICNIDQLFAQDELNCENKSTEEAPDQMEEDKEPEVPPELLYEVPPSCPPLTELMIQVNSSALDMDPCHLIHASTKYKLQQRDLSTLTGEEWLNDQVVNFYLELIRKRSLESGELLKVYYFYAAFYTLLDSPQGLENSKDAADADNIFENDLILFPVCVSKHWLLVVASVQEKKLTVYNSLRTSKYQESKICDQILQFLRCEYNRRFGVTGEEEGSMATGSEEEEEGMDTGSEVFQESEWIKRRKNGPVQNNGNDCGVFLLQFAEYLSRSVEFDFGPAHMPYFRHRIMYECITGKLLT